MTVHSASSAENGSKARPQPSSSSDRSAFSWGDNAGPLLGAALAGAAIGFAANYGRKVMMQGLEAAAGDWDEILAAEHEMALGIFDKMLATDETQTWKRRMLLMKLTHALDKHAHQEEMVVYPALREANQAGRRRPARRRARLHQDLHLRAEEHGPERAQLARKGPRVPRARLEACAHGGGRGLPAPSSRR